MGKSKREREKQTTQGPLTGNWTHVVRILLFSASIITAYLALATLSKGGQVPGCGPESDCEKVLTSSWAYWLSIPVSLPVSPTHSVGMLPLAPGVVNLSLRPERQSGTC